MDLKQEDPSQKEPCIGPRIPRNSQIANPSKIWYETCKKRALGLSRSALSSLSKPPQFRDLGLFGSKGRP